MIRTGSEPSFERLAASEAEPSGSGGGGGRPAPRQMRAHRSSVELQPAAEEEEGEAEGVDAAAGPRGSADPRWHTTLQVSSRDWGHITPSSESLGSLLLSGLRPCLVGCYQQVSLLI